MRFEDLDVWKRAARMSADLYQTFALSRDYGFREQITRSGLSIASNIAEGYERDSAKDRAKFLTYAKGSAGELRTQVYIGQRAQLIEPAKAREWIAETEAISKMLYVLIQNQRARQ